MAGIRKRSVQSVLLTAALVGLAARTSRATLQVLEDFNPAGTGADLDQTPAAGGPGSVSGMGLNGTTGGNGFTQGDWYNDNFGFYTKSESGGGINGPQAINRTATSSVTTNGLTTNFVYPTNSSLASLPAPTGGAAQGAPGYGNALYEASLTTPIPLSGSAGTIYFSYLLGDQGNGGADYQAQLVFDGSATKIYAGFGYGSRDDIDITDATSGITPFGNGNSHQASGGSYSSGFNNGTLGLVLGQINTTAAGADTVSVKIFPYTAGSTALIPVNPSNITWDTTVGLQTTDTITQLGIFLAGNTAPTIDAIRVGTTYADAVGTITAVGVAGSFTQYTGAISGAFDTTTKNFQSSTGAATPIVFTPGDNVLFDDSATGTSNIIVASGGVAPSSLTFNNLGKTYVFTGGAITATGLLNVVGGGTVTLGNSNSFAGGINLSNGTVVLPAGSTLNTPAFTAGAGNINFNGGTLQASNSSTSFLTSQGLNVLAGGAIIDTQAFNISIGSSLLQSGTSNGGLTKIGSGVLVLSGHSTYTGGTTVSAGTLVLASGGGNGDILGPLTISSGATVQTSSGDALGYNTNQAISTLTINAGGTLINTSGGNEGYITSLVMNGGTLSTSNGGSFNVNGLSISSLANSVTSIISSDVYIRGGVATPTTFNVASGAAGTTSGSDLTISGRILSNGGALIKTGAGILTLSGSNTVNGVTNVSAGTLVVASGTSLNTPLIVGSGATVVLANHGLNPTFVPIIGVAPTANNALGTPGVTNSGTIDLTNNALVDINNSVGVLNTQVAAAYNNGKWTGTSPNGVITSSVAASDTTHLTAVGVATGFTSFEGQTVSASSVLVKYTYYGDTNLDGKVDGSDYSRIDAAYLSGTTGTPVTGWYNGDFNYDGVINGSDYTLIDNAFNTQGALLANQLATPTAEIAGAGSSVPEPTSMLLLGIGAMGLMGRRRRQK